MNERKMPQIDERKMVFVAIDWMKKYEGITEDDQPEGTCGSYEKKEKHELFNFKKDCGYCYGYTPPYGSINLERICKSEIKFTSDGRAYLDNVLIVFCSRNKNYPRRRVVGFYVGATLYGEKKCRNDRYYNAVVKVRQTFLFEDEQQRTIELPEAKGAQIGYGRHNLWYADQKDIQTQNFRKEIVSKISTFIETTLAAETQADNDDSKLWEGELGVHKINQAQRNRIARAECLNYFFPHGARYKCQICGFDFEETYGEIGRNYIVVHHRESHADKSNREGKHEIDPRKDLIPVCPNCHAMLHKQTPPYDAKEIKNFLQKNCRQ